jgi:hypothetical protein
MRFSRASAYGCSCICMHHMHNQPTQPSSTTGTILVLQGPTSTNLCLLLAAAWPACIPTLCVCEISGGLRAGGLLPLVSLSSAGRFLSGLWAAYVGLPARLTTAAQLQAFLLLAYHCQGRCHWQCYQRLALLVLLQLRHCCQVPYLLPCSTACQPSQPEGSNKPMTACLGA